MFHARYLKPLAFLLACVFVHGSAADEDSPEYARVGKWSVRVDNTMGDGCFLHTYFKRGTALRLGRDMNRDTLYVVIGNPHWENIRFGETYPIGIQFGGRERWSGDAVGMSFDPPEDQPFIWFFLSASDHSAVEFLREFMREYTMEFFFRGESIARLSLEGSHRATMKLMECQRRENQRSSGTRDKPQRVSLPSGQEIVSPAGTQR